MLRQVTEQFTAWDMEPLAGATRETHNLGDTHSVIRLPAAGGSAAWQMRLPWNMSPTGGMYVECVGSPQAGGLTGTVIFDVSIGVWGNGSLVAVPAYTTSFTITVTAAGTTRVWMNPAGLSFPAPILRYYQPPGGMVPDHWMEGRLFRTGLDTLATGFDIVNLTMHYREEA